MHHWFSRMFLDSFSSWGKTSYKAIEGLGPAKEAAPRCFSEMGTLPFPTEENTIKYTRGSKLPRCPKIAKKIVRFGCFCFGVPNSPISPQGQTGQVQQESTQPPRPGNHGCFSNTIINSRMGHSDASKSASVREKTYHSINQYHICIHVMI